MTGRAAEQVLPDGLDALAELDGVGELVGAMSTEVSPAVYDGDGTILLSDEPYFSAPNTFRVRAFDPVRPDAGWNRGVAGQDRLVGAVDGRIVTLGAAAGDVYRLRVLDGATGSIVRCVDLPRAEDAGIERTASTLLPDGTVAVAVPTENGSGHGQKIAVIDPLTDGEPRWQTSIAPQSVVATSVAATLIFGQHPSRDALGGLRVDPDDPRTASVTALDSGSGETRWSWPTDGSRTAAAIVGVAEGEVPLVLLRSFKADDVAYDLLALDARTGEQVWRVADVTRASVLDDVVLVQLGLHTGGVDVRTGDLLWSETTADPGTSLDVNRAMPWGSAMLSPTRVEGLVVVNPATGDRLDAVSVPGLSPRATLTATAEYLVVMDPNSGVLATFDRE
ncbi:MAG: PQQ-binding-like beta-propeller repeat protein [Microthrixaceae bacterium]